MKLIDEVLQIVYNSIDDLNAQNSLEIVKDPSTKLFGSDGTVDSLALVNLIVIIEEKVGLKYKRAINIASDSAMSQKHSPFKSVQSLSEYIVTLL